jgi:predicted DNA-binding transcriptional regulator YafY
MQRQFEILYFLLSKGKTAAKELALHFGVSTRTIYRDIDSLNLAGVPVYAERGKGGGIGLLPNYVVDKSLFSEHEQSEILASLHGLSTIKTDGTESVLQKLSAIFNKTPVNWLDVDFSGWGHENDYFNVLKTAILERRVVAFDYYNSSGEKNSRLAQPVQLWFKSASWYLKAFCLASKKMRLFKLARIKNLSLTDKYFSPHNGLDVMEDLRQGKVSEGDISFKFRIAPEMAYRIFDTFSESMIEKQPDGSFIVNVVWAEDAWVYGFILSFGNFIEVLEPKRVRDIIKKEAEKISEKY